MPLVKPLSDLPKALRSTSPNGFDLGGELTGSALSPSLAGLNGRCVPLACPPERCGPVRVTQLHATGLRRLEGLAGVCGDYLAFCLRHGGENVNGKLVRLAYLGNRIIRQLARSGDWYSARGKLDQVARIAIL